jgi:hypothetical protein
MSMADTAEYQRKILAEAMTAALLEEEKTVRWRDPVYREGYLTAMTKMADAMDLKARVSIAYSA